MIRILAKSILLIFIISPSISYAQSSCDKLRGADLEKIRGPVSEGLLVLSTHGKEEIRCQSVPGKRETYNCNGNIIHGETFTTKNGKKLIVEMKNFRKYNECEFIDADTVDFRNFMMWEGPLFPPPKIGVTTKQINYMKFVRVVLTRYNFVHPEF